MDRQEFEAWERRVADRAERLWDGAGRPEGGAAPFMDRARELLAIEENPHATTRPLDETDPDGEPIEAVENQGEFPTLTDQGEERTYPQRAGEPDWK
ncbi:hypothetical protein LAZ40_23495 [Cereibacter sphaeroides]|uniref:hypothetical protein n=1 Tax=Rhodobacterales TaxID=204455 RepID=UPI000BBF312A|nr:MULTISPECIES: hypothetical protein [Paracoccaceae]MCE6952896.1 hypothetical protein [Cereibacter sphaeroides]MCE6962006.1 hypothetical protein [Cereibacter sphaeroides]MCE6970781.1 hypothetical protein [Cereibacter sphaeroides]MCE6975623.1 hypothetical protein [Cereibacter sphaeroides]